MDQSVNEVDGKEGCKENIRKKEQDEKGKEQKKTRK
jgi:hypothetical protein